MKRNRTIPTAILLLLGTLVVWLLWSRSEDKRKTGALIETEDMPGSAPDKPEEIRKEFHLVPNQSYITPLKFSVGMMPASCRTVNNCNHDVLYPINPPDVDYGWKMPSNCPCAQFVRAP